MSFSVPVRLNLDVFGRRKKNTEFREKISSTRLFSPDRRFGYFGSHASSFPLYIVKTAKANPSFSTRRRRPRMNASGMNAGSGNVKQKRCCLKIACLTRLPIADMIHDKYCAHKRAESILKGYFMQHLLSKCVMEIGGGYPPRRLLLARLVLFFMASLFAVCGFAARGVLFYG